MQPLKEQAVYTVVDVEDNANGSYDPFDINENSCWLEKKENMIVLTKEEFEKAIGDAFDNGEGRGHHLNSTQGMFYPKGAPTKEQYINKLLLKKQLMENEIKNYPSETFIQKSKGAEPNPPIQIEFYNGSIILTQEPMVLSINPESLDKLFEKIKAIIAK